MISSDFLLEKTFVLGTLKVPIEFTFSIQQETSGIKTLATEMFKQITIKQQLSNRGLGSHLLAKILEIEVKGIAPRVSKTLNVLHVLSLNL